MVTDEVYEHLVFDGEHVPIAGFPGMRERTVSVSSAGKTFSFTGWKIGWVKAAPELVTAVKTAKQFLTFVSGGPFQYAVAEALALPDEYYARLRDDLRAQRDLFLPGLRDIGFEVYEPQGTYFVTADIRGLGEQDGIEFCRTLPDRVGRGRHPLRRLLRPQGSGPQPRPLRLLQAPRGADRGASSPVPAGQRLTRPIEGGRPAGQEVQRVFRCRAGLGPGEQEPARAPPEHRSVRVDIRLGRGRAHERHVAERRHAIERTSGPMSNLVRAARRTGEPERPAGEQRRPRCV